MNFKFISTVSLSLFFGILSGFATIPAEEDDHIVAATLILEAGGEYDEGAMEAVYEVIVNRAKIRNLTLVEVCLQRKQFSCWNNKSVAIGINHARSHPRWNQALNIVNSPLTNYTKGADHYHADYIRDPYWAKHYTKTTKIGRHIFYKQ